MSIVVLRDKILHAVEKFNLNLSDKYVLTEAATGNYVVTSVLAAYAGATVVAYAKESSYGTICEVKHQTVSLAESLGVEDNISIVTSLDEVDLSTFDVVTNTGFLRPLDREIINLLSKKCVIPLMWEPWEYRRDDLDLGTCQEKGIKVYGTNESDERLRTMDYLGYLVLALMLENKLSPLSQPRVLLLGSKAFVKPTEQVLLSNTYDVQSVTDYTKPLADVDFFDVIVVLENEKDTLLVGEKDAYVNVASLREDMLVIHICGNVCFEQGVFRFIPSAPRPFGYMSYTTDYVDAQAIVDLHAAGLSVAEGMLEANTFDFKKEEYKLFMEKNYPALAFLSTKYW